MHARPNELFDSIFFLARFLILVALGTVLSFCYQESLGQSFDPGMDGASGSEPQVGQMTEVFMLMLCRS